MPIIPTLEKPRSEYGSIREVFEATLEHERFITGKINELAGAAFEAKDFSAFNFLQYFVAEQHEEEALFSGILDRFGIVGDDGRGLFMLDKEIGQMHGPVSADPATAGEA
jgi:ferritin